MHRMAGALSSLRSFALALAGFLLLLAASPAAAQTVAGQFLVISDFHFDPFDGLTRQQFEALSATPLADWPKMLASQPVAAYGRDAPYSLLQSSLDDAVKRIPDPDFILCPGDFLAHSWQTKYDQLAARSRSDDRAAYREFTTRTMRFLADRVRQAYPSVPFLPVLGNDDSYCGDYMIASESPFLSMFAEVWGPLLHAAEDSGELAAFDESFARGGNYQLRLPKLKNHRLLALNTVFFSTQYDNACGESTATPALDQLAWLEKTLGAAQQAGESVWLLMHIPPGIDSYSASRANGAARASWQPELTAQFLRLMQRFQSTVQIAIAGHTHMDDFRVARREAEPLLLTKIVPSISPIFRNNPGYQTFQHDRARGAIENYKTHFLPLAEKGPSGAPSWRAEYDYRETYKLPEVSGATIVALADQIAKGGPAQTAYARYYSVGGPAAPLAIKLLGCAIMNTVPGGFNACYQGIAPSD